MSSVSVVVPCYNYAHFLPGCLDSVLSQEGVELDVVIIDDASSDASAAVAADAAGRDERVRLRHHATNRGNIATFNEGLAEATGDYTVILSADDLLAPGALKRAADVLDAHPGVGFVYGRPVYFASDSELPEARMGQGRVEVWAGRDWIARRCEAGTNCISSPEVMVRTRLQHELGGYRTDLPCSGDLEMWLRFAAHSDVASLWATDQAFYRVHSASMLRQAVRDPMADLRNRKGSFDAFFTEHGAFVPGAGDLQRRVGRVLAREALWAACRMFDRRRWDPGYLEELEAFAAEEVPNIRTLPEYWGLAWRKRIGPEWCPRLQPLVLTAVVRYARNRLWWRQWSRSGV